MADYYEHVTFTTTVTVTVDGNWSLDAKMGEVVMQSKRMAEEKLKKLRLPGVSFGSLKLERITIKADK